jgi:predicted metal-dependent hydrolase
MGQIRLPGNPPIDVVLRRSARARRLSLRMSQLDGRVTLTLPQNVPESIGRDFLREKEAWLRGHLEQREGPVLAERGAEIPIERIPHLITEGSGRSITRQAGQLLVPGGGAQVPVKTKAWLRNHARVRLASASDRYAAALGRPYTRLTLRDTRSRWGSCTHDGRLMYSWRLILAPAYVLEYVAAHEVAHLQEMNHSQAFWDVVEHLYGEWQPARQWLHTHGADLHRYRFGD